MVGGTSAKAKKKERTETIPVSMVDIQKRHANHEKKEVGSQKPKKPDFEH